MGLDAYEQVADVLVGMDAVQIAGRDDALEDREVLRSLDVAGEEEVLSAERDDPQDPLGEVVVCALKRRVRLPGESPGRETVVPTGSTRGGSGGNK
jgi:hypothetical protein